MRRAAVVMSVTQAMLLSYAMTIQLRDTGADRVIPVMFGAPWLATALAVVWRTARVPGPLHRASLLGLGLGIGTLGAVLTVVSGPHAAGSMLFWFSPPTSVLLVTGLYRCGRTCARARGRRSQPGQVADP